MEAEKNNVVEIDHLYKSFGTNDVLKDFSMHIGTGESVAVLGKSGSGKSVLIKCMVGLLAPDKGSIRVFNNDVQTLSHDAMDSLRARIGFLFQSNALYDSMTVRDNLVFPLRHWKEKNVDEEHAVDQALEDVGLLHTKGMMPMELSGGMRKRIALARTLILRPEIILYDEPTTGLDPVTAREISQLIVQVQKKYNAASLIISHDMNCIRITANRIVMLIDGTCYANDTATQLMKSVDPRIHEFFFEAT